MSIRTGFIGLGAMGSPMALNIIKAGIPLIVHDVDDGKTREHQKPVPRLCTLLWKSRMPRIGLSAW